MKITLKLFKPVSHLIITLLLISCTNSDSPSSVNTNITIPTNIATEEDTLVTVSFSLINADGLNLQASSSNTMLIPQGNISVSIENDNGSLEIMPADNQFGTATINLELVDNSSIPPRSIFIRTVNIEVSSIDDAPMITSTENIIGLDENSSGTIHTLTAIDIENDEISYSISGDDSDLISIDQSGNISFKTPPNYELPNSASGNNNYEITVSVSTNDTTPILNASQDITLQVINVDEAPIFNTSSSISIEENTSDAFITLEAIDPEGSNVSYLISGGLDLGLFNLSDNKLAFNVPPDYENPQQAGNTSNQYQINIQAMTDNSVISSNLLLTITVTNIVNEVISQTTAPLNDTGITLCGDYSADNSMSSSNNDLPCELTQDIEGDPIPLFQDGHIGRDADSSLQKIGGGAAGFDFTKLDQNGIPLLDQSQNNHDCVKDNHTGLIWEVKKGDTTDNLDAYSDEGLHDRDSIFSWYDTNPNTNGGDSGEELSSIPNTCHGFINGSPETYCNTQAFISRVNAATLCGANDWRLPTIQELIGIAHFGANSAPFIDISFFPGAVDADYLSSNTSPTNNGTIYVFFYREARIANSIKSTIDRVRLVRSEN